VLMGLEPLSSRRRIWVCRIELDGQSMRNTKAKIGDENENN
jgi:hypothetical protein